MFPVHRHQGSHHPDLRPLAKESRKGFRAHGYRPGNLLPRLLRHLPHPRRQRVQRRACLSRRSHGSLLGSIPVGVGPYQRESSISGLSHRLIIPPSSRDLVVSVPSSTQSFRTPQSASDRISLGKTPIYFASSILLSPPLSISSSLYQHSEAAQIYD